MGENAGLEKAQRKSAKFSANIAGNVDTLNAPSSAEFARYCTREHGRPLVIKGAFARPELCEQWTPAYLGAAAGDKQVLAYVSADGRFPGGRGPYDDKVHRAVEMSMRECIERMSSEQHPPILAEGERCYLYQANASLFGDLLQALPDPAQVPTRWSATGKVIKNLWISSAGNITPLHHDYVENILLQVNGVKRVLLWGPEQYDLLYVTPFGEPHDRQSPIDVNDADLEKYPRFAEASALEAVLGPGDMLYLPLGWFHHIETEEMAVSINYWWPLQAPEGGFDITQLWKTLLFQLLVPFYGIRRELKVMLHSMLREQWRLFRARSKAKQLTSEPMRTGA